MRGNGNYGRGYLLRALPARGAVNVSALRLPHTSSQCSYIGLDCHLPAILDIR
jgi:hypothetical protein